MKIGIDLGGSHIGVGIIEKGEIIYKIEKDLKKEEKGTKNIVELIIKIVDTMIKQNNINLKDIEVIGIACPGVVEDGMVRKAENLYIKEIDFKKELKEKYKNVKINVANDAKCAAIAEKKYGILKQYNNAIMLTIGTGIGGAIFYNGKMLKGENSSAFEIGHIIINKNGKKCSCNSRGCFEAYASIGNLRKEVKEKLGIKREITGIELLGMLKNADKDEILKEILDEYIENLSIGIASISNIFEPEAIVLGGSIVYYKDIILEKLNHKLKTKEYIFNKKEIPTILMAELNNDAGMIGATIL